MSINQEKYNIKFTNFNKSQDDILKFDVINANSAFVNTLRRIIISHVKTISFDTTDYENSDLKIIDNTSSFHNEFLLHRLGLIPIYGNPDVYDPSKYKFSLNIENTSSELMNITTEHIKVLNIETNIEEKNDNFFKKNSITNDYILIATLNPGPNLKGEKLKFEGKSSINIGESHIRFSPVSCIYFVNKQDPELVKLELNKYLEINKDKFNVKKLTHKFILEEADRYFHIDDDGNPNQFEFCIESRGVLEPYKILLNGINLIIDKINLFLNNMKKTLSDTKSDVLITESKGLMKAFDITILNENHTLGYLLQTYINEIYKENNIFIGYLNPHPLEKKIILKISLPNINIDQVNEIINTTCKQLLTILDNIKKEISSEFGGKVIIRKKQNKTK
jgi:DNA-directed RNA polymerase subunit L